VELPYRTGSERFRAGKGAWIVHRTTHIEYLHLKQLGDRAVEFEVTIAPVWEVCTTCNGMPYEGAQDKEAR